MKDTYIIVPSYNPNEEIMSNFILELKKSFKNIIIVNDGCYKEYDDYFKGFEEKGITILKHHINQGKGRAIKTAFNYLCNEHKDFKSTVTADCDGQHTIEDIKTCSKLAIEFPNNLILGVRDFDQKQVPTQSKLGNKITRTIFKIFIGLSITDTQTGLRGFSKKMVETFLGTPGERYEYETNMLIECKYKDIKIKETKIDTIYINNNATSHFNPVKDSIIIYKLFFKYILSSISSFLLDILLFTIFLNIFKNTNESVLISTILSRVISSIYNYLVNGKFIFKNANKLSLYKYFFLVLTQMFISGFSVTYLSKIFINSSKILIKIIVDIIIFIINFVVQRDFVFKNQN